MKSKKQREKEVRELTEMFSDKYDAFHWQPWQCECKKPAENVFEAFAEIAYDYYNEEKEEE